MIWRFGQSLLPIHGVKCPYDPLAGFEGQDIKVGGRLASVKAKTMSKANSNTFVLLKPSKISSLYAEKLRKDQALKGL